MGLYAETLGQANPADTASPVDDSAGRFQTGMRSGAAAAVGKLRSLVGGFGEAVGADDFAARQHAAAAQSQGQAEEAASTIPTLHDIGASPDVSTGMRNAYNWASGTAGQFVPEGAAMIAGGLLAGPGGAMAAAVPTAMGESIQRQRADPESMRASPMERLGAAGAVALPAAALNTVAPELAMGRLLGPVGKSMSSIAARGVGDAAAMGGASAGTEAVQQGGVMLTNPDKPLDTGAVANAGVEGLATGALIGGAGAAAQAARRGGAAPFKAAGEAVGNLADRAKQAATDATTAAKDADAGSAPVSAPVDLRGLADKATDAFSKAKAGAQAFINNVAAGKDIADPNPIKGMSLDQVKEMMPTLDADRVQAMTDVGRDLLSKAGLTPEVQDRVAQAMGDMTSKANQAIVAGASKTWTAAKDFADNAKGLAELTGLAGDARDAAKSAKGLANLIGVADVPGDAMKSAKGLGRLTGVMKSEDYSGINGAIAEHVLPELMKAFPEAVGNPDAQRNVVTAVRNVMQLVNSGGKDAISADHLSALIHTLGDHTVDILDAGYRAIADKANAAQSEAFFGTLNKIGELQARDKGLFEVMSKSLDPTLAEHMTTSKLREQADVLRQWAQTHAKGQSAGQGTLDLFDSMKKGFDIDGKRTPVDVKRVPETVTGLTTEAGRYHDSRIRELLSTYYGDKADAVLKAVEKDTKLSKDAHDEALAKRDAEHETAKPDAPLRARGLDEMEANAVYYGRKNGTKLDGLTLAKEHEMPSEHGSYVDGRMERAKAENPDRSVSFLSAKDLGEDHPSVQAKLGELANHFDEQGHPDPAAAAKAEIGKYGIVAAEGTRQKTAFTRDDLPKLLLRKEGGDTPSSHFKSKSRLQAGEEGEIFDARKITREMERRNEGDSTPADNKSTLHRTGRMFMDGVAALQDHLGKTFKVPDETVIDGRGTTYGDIKKLDYTPPNKAHEALTRKVDALRKEYEAAETDAERTRIKDEKNDLIDAAKIFDPREIKEFDAGFDKDPRGNIHELGSKVEELHTGEDGRPLKKSDAPEPGMQTNWIKPAQLAELNAKIDKLATTGAAGKAIATKARALLDNADILNAAAHKTLAGLLKGKTVSDVGSAVNALYAKYKNKLSDTTQREKSPAANDSYNGAPEVASKGPKGEARAYASTLKSAQKVDPAATGPIDRKAMREYLTRTLDNSVLVEPFSTILHAGEFEAIGADHIIRISAHSLNPLSTAYHESLHAFFAKLRDQGNKDVTRILENVAQGGHVMDQLHELLKGEPAALKQLDHPEEAAAYMYQFWAAGQLKLGAHAKGWFEKLADAFKKVLGIWTNDQRATQIMDYFHSGEYAKSGMGDQGAVARALVDAGRNHALDTIHEMTTPLRNFSEAVATAGHQRLRDTGNPALIKLANLIKLEGTGQGKDVGYLPAARAQHTQWMNDLSQKLSTFTKAQRDEAMEAMQEGRAAASPEARLAQRVIQGPDGLLPRMLKYMQDAGVNVMALKMEEGSNYFPRVWDTSFIAGHQAQFLKMLDGYKRSGAMKGEPLAVLQKLMAVDGAEFTLETNKPGMQFAKERLLAFISDKDAAGFVRKDLFETLNGYIQQATRRAEWSRRMGDDGSKLEGIMAAARAGGASDHDIQTANTYLKAVDGTLGDDSKWMSPQVRKQMGNMVVYQNIRLLPLGIFSSVVDPLGIVVRGGTVKGAWSTLKRGIGEIKNNFKDVAPDEQTKFAQLVGTIDDAMLRETIGTSYSQGMVGDTGRKINDALFKWNWMDQFNRSMRVGATQAAREFLETHADGKASKHSERWMRELGYEPGEYKAGVLDDKAKAAMNRWVDGAVLRPDAADKAIWMSDPRWALVAHLKTFVYSFHQTILKRVAHEYRHGNYAPGMALASYVPVMIASDMIKGLIQGGGDTPDWKKNWDAADYVEYGAERGGLLGVGQFAVDAGKDLQRGGIGIGSLTGPTIEQLTDGLKTIGGREAPKTFALDSMPANALYKGFVKGGSDSAGAMFAD